jgi:hypothetical protein
MTGKEGDVECIFPFCVEVGGTDSAKATAQSIQITFCRAILLIATNWSLLLYTLLFGINVLNKVGGKPHTIHGWDESEPQ